MTDRLDGTVALVTGASSGIGEAAAIELAAQGPRWRWPPGARTAQRTGRQDPRRRRTAHGAHRRRDRRGGRQGAGRADRGGARRLDTLINNAGVMLLGPVQDAPTDEWRTMVHVNLLGLLYCAHAALPHLLQAAGSGPRQVADLVNISSVAGRVARSGSGVYNATKHGVGAFSEALRQEVGSAARAGLAGRAGRHQHRAGQPQPAGDRSGWASASPGWSGWSRRHRGDDRVHP